MMTYLGFSRKLLTVFLFCLIAVASYSQKYVTQKSAVSFYSHAAIEDITAENSKTSGIFNASTNDIAFSVPIREFKFRKSLMQEHFNEKYLESEKYPKATFQGKVTGFDINTAGQQKASATGKLTIHGVTQDAVMQGTAEKSGDKIIMKAKFIVKLADYKIEIPQLLWKNIAEQVEVTVDFTFSPQ